MRSSSNSTPSSRLWIRSTSSFERFAHPIELQLLVGQHVVQMRERVLLEEQPGFEFDAGSSPLGLNFR